MTIAVFLYLRYILELSRCSLSSKYACYREFRIHKCLKCDEMLFVLRNIRVYIHHRAYRPYFVIHWNGTNNHRIGHEPLSNAIDARKLKEKVLCSEMPAFFYIDMLRSTDGSYTVKYYLYNSSSLFISFSLLLSLALKMRSERYNRCIPIGRR